MEGINSFEKGLHRSNTPQMQPEGSYVDALNWIRNDSGRLVNEELEEVAQILNGNYELLGYCPIQDSFICFFKQTVGTTSYSEIGLFSNITKQYTQVFNDSFTSYFLGFTNKIDSVARINSYGETVVYFVEEDNPVRRFNITEFENLGTSKYTGTLYNSSEDWNLQLSFKMAYGEYSLTPGGSLPSGTYSFAYRYVTDQNNKTAFGIPSRFINVPGQVTVDANTNTIKYDDETLGGVPQSPSGLSIKIKLKNVDTNYDLIEVVVITYIGVTNALSIRSLGTYENVLDKEIIFSDDTQYVGDQISDKELLESPVYITSAKCIEQKDNILVLSDISNKQYDRGFQDVANDIELNWSIDKLPVDNRRNFSNVYFNKKSLGTTTLEQVVSDSITISKLPYVDPNGPASTQVTIFLSNEEITFQAPFTGYTFTPITGGCTVIAFLGQLTLTYNTSGANTYYVTSQTTEGATVAEGTISTNNTYIVPYPTAFTADVATTTLTIEIRNALGATIDIITKTITYKLSRPKDSSLTSSSAPFVNINLPTQYRFIQTSNNTSNSGYITPAGITLKTSNPSSTYIDYDHRSFRWKCNGIIIPGATGDEYTIPVSHFVNNFFNTYTVEVTYSYNNQPTLTYDAINFPSFVSETIDNKKYLGIYPYVHLKAVDEQNFQQSNVYADPFVLKGFQRGEVYSFSITPIYKDGSVGFSYHIPGKPKDLNKPNRLTGWTSIEDYSASYTPSLTGKIVHHKMPDYDETGFIGDTDYINVLRVTATNINFRQDQLNNIQGYIIGYQPRIDDLTKSVIDTGLAKPYIFRNVNNQGDFNYLYQGSLFDGRVEFNSANLGTANTGWNPAPDKPYLMYYSAETLLSGATPVKNNYKIQQIGFVTNKIVMKDPQYGVDTSVFFNPSYLYRKDRFLYHNASFCDRSIYSPEYLISRFPYLLTFLYPGTNPFFSFFAEFNGWEYNSGNKTQIKYNSYIDDIQTNASAITNFPKSILSNTSVYTHIETFLPCLKASGKLMVFINPSGSSSGTNTNRYLYEYSQTQFDALTNSNVQSSVGLGDPKFSYVRITNDNPSQYGKLENGTYTPAAVEFNDNGGLSSSILLEGDTYINKVFQQMVNQNIAYQAGGQSNSSTGSYAVTYNLIGYYTESKNNYALRHQEVNGINFFPKKKSITGGTLSSTSGLLNEPWNLDSIFYNRQYSAIANVRATFPKPLFFNEITSFSNRSVYSKQAFESELVDQYRIFPANNFHDIPKDRGAIKDTFVFNNNFYHHTEYGLWLSFFNPNTTQTTSQGQVVLGNAGVFQLPSKLVLDIKGGYMGTMDKSGTNTPFGRVFLDHKQGKVFLFAGDAPTEISDLGLFSFFRDFINTNDEYCMGYDWANKRLLLNNITREKAISYYPKTQTWTSFHDFSPKAYFNTNGYSYAYKESFFRGTGFVGTFYNLNNDNAIRKSSDITFVENTSPDAFKRFDRMELNTMSGGKEIPGSFLNYLDSPGSVGDNNYKFLDKSFSTIQCWTDRQNTTQLPLTYTHMYENNFLNSYQVNNVPVNYYRSSFHLELPLDAVIDPYKNIFSSSNTDINAEFRSHLKGKFLYTKLSYNENNPIVLNYVKTFFKPSVA